MILCPFCSQPMTARRPNGHPRRFCSKPCSGRANSNAIHTRNSSLDEVAVIRLIAGDLIRSTKAERVAAVRVLTVRGRSAAWIAQQLHITERSVTRHRAELHARREVAA